MDAEPKKLLALEEQLRKDLEAIARVRQLMALNGSLLNPDDRQLPLGITTKQSPRIENLEDDNEATHSSSLIRTIEEAINNAPAARWTTQKMLTHLNETGYPLRAAKPIYSVGQSLNKLLKQGKIRLARKGGGSEPNIYKGKVTDNAPVSSEAHSQGGQDIAE